MYNSQAARLTLYAFITSIESDLRDFLSLNINDEVENEILGHYVEKVEKRVNLEELGSDSLKPIIHFLDFGDLKQILDKIIRKLPNSFKKDLQHLSDRIDVITPIRNRVMHSRPLEFEDFPIVIDFIEEIDRYAFIDFNYTQDTKSKIKADPSYIYGLKLPAIDHKYDTILNNLPQPEFDDTGFVGRDIDRKKIKELILGHYPIISVVGDGGIGKTALVLSCLYDLLDAPDQPYEGIIWVSLKTRTLNNGEFINIKNSITNTIDIYNEINNVLESTVKHKSIEDLINNIIEYMKSFNILLVLDNLETINTHTIRDFLTRLPQNSKIITTSRIGIGEFENRYRLQGLTEKESSYYLRRLAKNNHLDILSKVSEKKLTEIAENLYFNPLAMKWFVANLLKGESIESILKHKENLTEYCMSNVYNKLSDDAKKILETMLICNKECSNAELTYLLNLNSISYGKAMNDLFATNIVYMRNDYKNEENRTLYFITDFAREYLRKYCRPTNKSFISINKKLRTLKGLSENLVEQTENDPYKIESIIITHPDEEISAFYLKKALTHSHKGEFSQADEYIDRARNATPDYFEVYKVSAFINIAKKDFFAAELDYQTALECKSNYAPILYFYAGFKLMFIENFDDAYDAIIQAESLDPKNNRIKMSKGRILKQMSKFPEAEKVFESVFLNYKNLDFRTQKILIDQASDNLRRWADKIRADNGDYAETLIKKAIDIMEYLDETLYDTKIVITITKIIKTLTYIYIENNNRNVSYLIYLLGKYYPKVRIVEEQDFKRPFDILLAKIDTIQREKILMIFSDNDVNHILQEEGFVIELKPKYGFIKNLSPNNLFFYWKDFEGDFSNLSIGNKVQFTVGKTERGLCAKNVKLI